MSLDGEKRRSIVESTSELIIKNYVFPDKGQEFAQQLREKLEAGEFDTIDEPDMLARTLTKVLHDISRDLHFNVQHNPEFSTRLEVQQARGDTDDNDDDAPQPDWIRMASYSNYHFKSVERLIGNIGYMDVRMFLPAEIAGETAIGAMMFLSQSDALIFDLRRHHGGSPTMIQLILTYLFSDRKEPKHLNSFYFRPLDKHMQTWTLPYVPGKRMPKVPVYVLTSNLTGSAAEEFTYNLKNMERATIIGETTAGAAHPVQPMPIGEGFVINMPGGRPINPISQTNWEGTGIEPHIAVPQEDALKVAHIHALENLIENTTDENKKRMHEWSLKIAKATYEPVTVDNQALEQYVGQYANFEIKIKDNQLVCRNHRLTATSACTRHLRV